MKKLFTLLIITSLASAQTICSGFDVNNFVLNGSANITGTNEVTLTTAQGSIYGTMWSNQEILFTEDFLIESQLFFGNNDWGADGIAFVLQPLSSNAGQSGGGIGYSGITPSLAIEFDTYFNSGIDPINSDHIAIIKNGQPFLTLPHSEFIQPINIGNIEDGQWHTAIFEWNSSVQMLKLTFDGVQLFDVNINLSTIFNNLNSVYWGFTSATGGANNLHKVKIDNYCVVYNTSETCNDGIDNDNDGFVDGFDTDCPCEDNTYFNICEPECELDFIPQPFSIAQNWESNSSIIPMTSQVVGDINNDGVQDILALGINGMTISYPRITSDIKIFSGTTGEILSTIATPFTYWSQTGQIAIADIDSDGFAEIFFASSDYGNTPNNSRYIYCYNYDGTLKWKSNAQYGYNAPGISKGGGALGIADFNYDGIPEIYIYNEIFNAQTGVKLIDGGNSGIGHIETSFLNNNNGVFSLSVAADLTSNFGLELAAGKTVYEINLTNLDGIVGNTFNAIQSPIDIDGFTAIADINLDGNLDVVVSSAGINMDSILYVWNPNSSSLIGSINMPSGYSPIDLVSIPFIGDMDSDGKPEIGLTRPYKLLAYKFNELNNNLEQFWELQTTDISGLTKLSMFDFNQDGIQELVYRDETQLRIINGSSSMPQTLASFPSLSGTAAEGPIIADINNDNQAEIVIGSENPNTPFVGSLISYKTNSSPWAPARKVWNQYGYFNVNINDDLSVPFQQQNHGLQFYETLGSCLGATLRPLNSFMAQETIRDLSGCPIYPAPDLTISEIDNIVYDCENEIITFDVGLENIGSTTVASTFNLLIYEGTFDSPGNLIQSQLVNTIITPSGQQSISVNLSNFNLTNFYAVLNFDDSTQNYPYIAVNECNYLNNYLESSLDAPNFTPTFTQVADICSGATLTALPTTSNNNITGVWSPELDNTVTTMYTFTPDAGQCATTASMTITVEPPSILYITNNYPNCNPSALSWSNLNNINSNTASASIDTNLITINKPTGGLFSTSNVFNGNIFPSQYNIPVNSLTLANNESGLFTFCFNTPVQNPQIAIASIGRPGLSVPINTSVPYQVIWAGPGMNFINNQSLAGEEGYCIIVFPGTHQCISFDYLVSESYCNIVFGTQDSNCQIEPICMGGSVELVPHGSTNITWSPINDLTFLPNSNHVIATPSQTTTYTITSNDTCQNQASITVSVNPNITPIFTQVAPICSGTVLTALPTTSDNGYIGAWSPALDNTATTTYTFTPDAGQCATTASMTIVVNQKPSAPTGDPTQVFCVNPLPIIADLTAIGTNIQWYLSETGTIPLTNSTFLVDGIYYATQTIDNCESSERLAVSVILNNPSIISSTDSICSGDEVNLTVEYYTNSLCDMDITPSNIPLGDPIPGFSYGGLFNGHYYYVYNTPTSWTDGELICRQNGGYLVCINDINENIFVSNLTNNNIWIGMFRDPDTCEFRWLDCMDISFTNWRPGEPNSAPCGEPYVQIIRGCSFGLNTWNNLGNNSNNGSCYSNMVPIMEIDPLYTNTQTQASILWSTGETTSSISTNPNVMTEYWVDITINGVTCREYKTINVIPGTIPEFTQVSDICSGATLTALPTTSNNGYTGVWSPALDNTVTTTYTFTPDAGQCATTANIAITVNPNITPTFTQVADICSGATLTALPTTSNNNITGVWSPALDNTATTTYTFTPDVGQCATTASMTITVNPNITPTFTQVTPICSGAVLTALPTTSDNGYTGTWSPAFNNTVTTMYTFTPTAGQCATTASMTITVNPNITPTFTQVADICSGAVLTALPMTSDNGYTGVWSPALDNTATTTYSFTPDAGQCATTTSMTIIVNPNITPTFTQVAPICSGAVLTALPTTSDNGYTGVWSPAFDNTATTTYTFTPDAGQCATTASMTITVNPNITPTFTQVADICSGATLTALPTTSNNNIIGVWSPALDNTATTTYTFTPNAGQCATTASMTITVNQLPLAPSGDAIQMFCAIDYPTIADLVMSSNSIYWYDSLNGGAPLASNTLLIDGTTLYCSSFDNVTLCENPIRTPVQIQVDNPPLPNIESFIEFCLENQFTTQAIETNGITMNWYDSIVGGNLIASDYVLQDGDVIYGAAYNSITDCESDSRIVLDIVIKNSTLNFYNLITIDDNNLNEELIIEGIEQFPNNSIEIYNRYGNLVWSSDNYNNEDNTFKGQSSASGVLSQESYLPTGTYFLIISYPNDCEKTLLKGFIQIDNKL